MDGEEGLRGGCLLTELGKTNKGGSVINPLITKVFLEV